MRSHAVIAYAPTLDPDRLIIAWRGNWPAWTWAEFRDGEAERFRDLLSPAHASMIHAGDIVQVLNGEKGHGDFERIEPLLG
jgi:hypothetical protein